VYNKEDNQLYPKKMKGQNDCLVSHYMNTIVTQALMKKLATEILRNAMKIRFNKIVLMELPKNHKHDYQNLFSILIKTNENYNQRQKSQELPISRNFTTIGNADIHVQLAHVLQLLPLPFYTFQYYILSSIDNVSSF